MPDYPEIFVLRHGQTEWNRDGIHQGRLNSNLTELGQQQADQQGQILASALAGRSDLVALCSPQGRARHTADIALAHVGLEPTEDDRLQEVHFGQWQGLTFDDIAPRWPEQVKNADTDPFGWHFQAPGGESLDALSARAGAVLAGLSGPTIIVTHGITSRVLRGLWLGGQADLMAELPGGQGCVFHLKDGEHRKLT